MTKPIVYRGKRYPDNWKTEIRPAIMQRAGDKCEWCGAVNYEPHPVTGSKVVLTIAHLGVEFPDGTPGNKHDKFDVRPENLAALCNRCHLNYDRDDHIRHAKETRRKKKEKIFREAGQLTFWDALHAHEEFLSKPDREHVSDANK